MVKFEEWAFTPHAERRRIEMKLTRRDIVSVLNEDFTREYPGSVFHYPGLTVRADDTLAVVFNDEEQVVVTILWDGAIGRDEDGQPVYAEGHR